MEKYADSFVETRFSAKKKKTARQTAFLKNLTKETRERGFWGSSWQADDGRKIMRGTLYE